jgi:hypothetical protein
MNAVDSLPVLLTHIVMTDPSLSPAPDLRYWSMVSALVLETLAGHKLVPSLVAMDNGKTYQARWLPVLDATKDAARLIRLETAMPPVCRAAVTDDIRQSPRMLLNHFINTFCD